MRMEPGLNVIVSLSFPVAALLPAPVEVSMSVSRAKLPRKTFHATMTVTRVEEWCVEAQTPEEARTRLAAGEGHRCHLGDCLHRELDTIDSAEEAA